ncbi:hypothetical protein MBANPS3_006835 [Mucor bainieri]
MYNAVKSISPFSNDSELPYIKLATQKLCHLLFTDVLKTDHNEVWYRANVYGDIFDYVFTVKAGYEAKRSECHSNIVKSLKGMGFLPPDQQNVKLGFIFFHLAISNDGLVCEDKPTEKESSKDRKKVEDLRQNALQYWQHMLPFDECIHHLTAVSCQFSRLKVKICGTKLINNVTVHTTLKEATIPMEENDGAS